ncbi:MAG TPA: cytochrome P450, partial [Dehalococcoidia bacterium]|nr:cytochrome P450 [Dehalococcoidia bacterium]
MTTMTLADLYSADTYAQAMPHDTFDVLRREDPVHWQPEPEGQGYWALTRYEDIVGVSSDNELFSSARGGTNLEDLGEDALTM